MWSGERLAKTMASMSSGFHPAWSRARRVARWAISALPSPGSTQWRSWMPVRWTIHSSVVSMSVVNSWLVTTRSGT